jgi:predicted GNAT family acetyltransferase
MAQDVGDAQDASLLDPSSYFDPSLTQNIEREHRRREIMSEFRYALMDVAVSGALDWSIGAVKGGFGTAIAQGYRYGKATAYAAKAERNFGAIQARTEIRFAVDNGSAGNLFRVSIQGRRNSHAGAIQGMFNKSTKDLNIDVITSQVKGKGMGSALFKKLLSEVEKSAGKVSSISGNFARGSDNLKVFLSKSLQDTPAFKFRYRLGFTKIIEMPSAANNYLLIMAKP